MLFNYKKDQSLQTNSLALNTIEILPLNRIRGVILKFNLVVDVYVQLLSNVQLFETTWTAACQASLSFTISWSLLRFMSIESVMLSNHLILCRPFLLLSSIFPIITVFSDEYSGLFPIRIDWFALLAV